MLLLILLYHILLANASTATKKAHNESNTQINLAATELDMLIPPPIDEDKLVGLAAGGVAVTSQNHIDIDVDNDSVDKPGIPGSFTDWKFGLLIATATLALLLMVAFVTHCLWRRHIERQADEWEAENARILSNTTYYLDRSQILVY